MKALAPLALAPSRRALLPLAALLPVLSSACTSLAPLPRSPHLEGLTEQQVFANAPRAEWPVPTPDTAATAPVELTCGVAPQVANNTIYAAIDLRAKPGTGAIPPLNLSLVLDRSGSMSGAPFRSMLQAAEAFVGSMRDGDRLSVVVFSDGIFEAVPPVAIDAATRADAVARIRALRDGGATWLSGGLLAGYFEILTAFVEWNVNQVLLMSDGVPTDGITDSNQLFALAARAAEHGIGTTTIGFGYLHDELLMQGLADAGGGTYHYVGAPGDIPVIFQREATSILRTAVRGAWISTPIPQGLEVEDVIGWDYLVVGNQLYIFFGALPYGEERYAVIKLLPKAPFAAGALPIQVAYSDMTRRGKFGLTCGPGLGGSGGRESWVLELAGRAEAAWGLAEAMGWADADREVFAISQIQYTRDLLNVLRAPLGPQALQAEDRMLADAQNRLGLNVAQEASGSFLSGGLGGLTSFATRQAEKTATAAVAQKVEAGFRPWLRQGMPFQFYGRTGTRYSARGQRAFVLHDQGKSERYKQARFDAYLQMRVRVR